MYQYTYQYISILDDKVREYNLRETALKMDTVTILLFEYTNNERNNALVLFELIKYSEKKKMLIPSTLKVSLFRFDAFHYFQIIHVYRWGRRNRWERVS